MPTEGGKAKRRKVQNILAVSYLRLILGSLKVLKMIKVSKIPDWPGGLVLADITTKLLNLKLNKRQDPEILEDEIEAIEIEYRRTIDKRT